MSKATLKKDTPISMRLREEDAERFRDMAAAHNMSQSEFLIELMDNYRPKLAEPEYKSNSISLEMQFYQRTDGSVFGELKLPSRMLNFSGSICVQPENDYQVAIDKRIAACLNAYFNLNITEEDVDYGKYELYDNLSLYYHDAERRYIVHERLSIAEIFDRRYANPSGEIILDLCRCRFVDDYNEVIKYFGNYAHRENLREINRFMTEDIGENYALMDEYFFAPPTLGMSSLELNTPTGTLDPFGPPDNSWNVEQDISF